MWRKASAVDDTGASAVTPGELPCDVNRILVDKCQRCRGRARFGAPMPLVTYADLQKPAVSDKSKKVADLVRVRTHDPKNVMPQGGPLPAEELAVLDAWIDGGAKPSTAAACATGDAGTTDIASGPASLPCTPTYAFRAHNVSSPGDEQPYAVSASESNSQICYAFKVPWTDKTKMTAFAPIIDDARVVHHWILFATNREQIDGAVHDCGSMPQDARFLAGWAPGGKNAVLPDDVALELPRPDEYLLLQVHYWNANGLTDARDRSGIAMCTTEQDRAHTAGWSTVGSLAVSIPPHSVDQVIEGNCEGTFKEPVTVLASAPHMHRNGTAIRTEILRGGDVNRAETLVDVPKWDFNQQSGYETPTVLQPGDRLRTRCTYTNPTDRTITFGENTEDEMCFNFVMAYPARALVSKSFLGARGICIDPLRAP
ncbi:MAG: hypothetical protein U0169_05685 [Polyangiaceae bacterium]